MKMIAYMSLLACVTWAQDSTPPAFEVASVKISAPFTPGPGRGPRVTPGCGKPDPAMVRCTYVTLEMLLMRAYDLKIYQIEGPAWIETERYDVMAKVPDGVPADKIPAMLQALLTERFAVKLHKETRSLPAYELSVAKGGPKLKEVDVSSGPVGGIGFGGGVNGSRSVRGNFTIDQLMNYFTRSLSRPVFDNTGLKGTYQIELTYLGDENDGMGRLFVPNGPPDDGRGDAGRQQDASAPIATLFQAVQQTLGLKLDSKKAPVEMIIIDSATKVPTEN